MASPLGGTSWVSCMTRICCKKLASRCQSRLVTGHGMASRSIPCTSQRLSDQGSMAQRKAAINFSPSNLIQATQAATPHNVGLFLCPSTAGLRDNGTYLKASMLMSASATTQYPDEVATFITFLFTNNGAVKALGIERGIPGSARA